VIINVYKLPRVVKCEQNNKVLNLQPTSYSQLWCPSQSSGDI